MDRTLRLTKLLFSMLLVIIFISASVLAEEVIIDLKSLVRTTKDTSPTEVTEDKDDVIQLKDLVKVPVLTEPSVKKSSIIRTKGWSRTKPSSLDKKQVLLTINENGAEKFFVYHKYGKEAHPTIEVRPGSVITIKLTLPNLGKVGDLTRSAYDADATGLKVLWQNATPRVSINKRMSPGGAWNGRDIEWQISAKSPTKPSGVLATMTVMYDVAKGAGPTGTGEARYMPKIWIIASEESAAAPEQSAPGSFEKIKGAYLYLPDLPKDHVKDVVIWLAGSGERDERVLNSGLPKTVTENGAEQIVLVPTKKDEVWDISEVAQTTNDILSYLDNLGYDIQRLYGEGFSAGGQGIARLVTSQLVNMPFTGITLFGSNTDGQAERLAIMLDDGRLAELRLYVGEQDDRFLERVKTDWKVLAGSSRATRLYIVPNTGHKVDSLYQNNTP